MEYKLNDIVVTKKEHPCDARSNRWQIIRVGADVKIKCLGCGHVVMLSKYKFEKNIKKIENNE